MEDECRDRTVGSNARTSISATRRQHEVDGPRARRPAFPTCPRGPDLLVPRHVRIHRMLVLTRPPCGDRAGDYLLGCGSLGALNHRIRVALQHDQRGCARRMCRREQRTRRDPRRPAASRTASRLPRSSNTAVMLSAHCSNVGSAPDVTGSDDPVPGWSKKISRPSDVIAAIDPRTDGSSGMSSQLLNHIGTSTMSRSPSADAR